jgi:hypothetical protein
MAIEILQFSRSKFRNLSRFFKEILSGKGSFGFYGEERGII